MKLSFTASTFVPSRKLSLWGELDKKENGQTAIGRRHDKAAQWPPLLACYWEILQLSKLDLFAGFYPSLHRT
jgi:hypothetical protein